MAIRRLLLLVLGLTRLLGAPGESGAITGRVVDTAAGRPVEYAAVTLRGAAGSLQHAVTDADGHFTFENLPPGDYQIGYGRLGERPQERALHLDAQRLRVDVGALQVGADVVKMSRVDVAARREALYESIDRRVYSVGKDVQAVTGSASDLLKNVPSVQVDIEGNVSLRGDPSVLILVNGKTSAMMGRNRAAVLEQLPADGIERVEVITNPSAKYKPEGTAGIINLVLRRKPDAGRSGTVRLLAGNQGRYNASATGTVGRGKLNLSGTVGLRQDDRPRTVHDERSHLDRDAGGCITTTQDTAEQGRPLSRVAQANVEYAIDDATKVGGAFNYNFRDFERTSTTSNRSSRPDGAVTADYDRRRRSPQFERDVEATGTLHHAFAGEDHELNVELRHGRSTEQEDNRYDTVYRFPAPAIASDATLLRNLEINTEGSVDFTRPLAEDAKLECGYDGQGTDIDMDFRSSRFDAGRRSWVDDAARTNRFAFRQAVHAGYATYTAAFGPLGAVAGVRAEDTVVHTHQVTAGRRARQEYARIYPSLHLTYRLTEAQQLQASYSHRVRRPDGDELNPFPEYQDPFNLRAGNPRLQPEDTHAIEAGWLYRDNGTSYLATAYVRHRYNSLTEVSRYLDATTLLTTMENLGSSTAGGIELGATTRVWRALALNLSGNAYRSEIDASNLGFEERRQAMAWDAKLNATWDASKTTLVQLNANYTARRLTPQGYRHPTATLNLGLKHTFSGTQTAFVLTISDVFASLKERTSVDTPVLREEIIRRRATRVVFAGFTHAFGQPAKKAKDDLPYDSAEAERRP